MNFKHKLGYMCIGCLFTIAGYILASLGGITTHVQQDEQVIDEIVCRRLKIVNREGKKAVNIGATTDGTGNIIVYNAAETGVVAISAVANPRMPTTPSEDGGNIGVYNAAEKRIVNIGATQYGGSIFVYDATEKEVAGIGATEGSDGFIRKW